MPPPNIVPWGLHPLNEWVKTELQNRSAEVGMNADLTKYSGPRTAWTRFFSNGTGVPLHMNGKTDIQKREGFIMGGVNGFDDSYGFNADGKIILGYDANGKEHSVSADTNTSFPHRPPPGVESIEVSLYGGQNSSFSGLCRKARVNWKCYSLDQLEYLAPYFLSPKVTSVLEWGWNNYDVTSLIDLTNKQMILDDMLDGSHIMDRIKKSSGNYDAMIGFIFDYGFSMNALGGYDCFTEFVNANWLVEGQDYTSTSINKVEKKKGEKDKITPMKTYLEFIGNDLNNLVVKDKDNGTEIKSINKEDGSKISGKINSKGKTFSVKNGKSDSDDKKSWLRMDLVQDIFNEYFSLVFTDIGGNKIGSGGVLDISETIICGHPAIKSIDRDVLIPNQFAPRFTTETSEAEKNKGIRGTGSLASAEAITPGGESYYKLFAKSGIESFLNDKKLTKEYDNLRDVINKGGNSFPMYKKGGPTGMEHSYPGTWGYLKDIFVSTDLIREVTQGHDSAYRMLEALLLRINRSLSGVVQLKIVPHQHNAKLSIIDTNYNPHAFPEPASTLLRFSPGSVNSAFMTSVGFSVKLSQEMASQMVAQSSAGNNVGGIQQSVGVQKANRFVGNDRLYEKGNVDVKEISRYAVEQEEKDISIRDFSLQVGKWHWYQPGSENNKRYILTERSDQFMQNVVSNDKSGKSIHINSPILSGTKFTMETLGIGGFTFLGQFTLDHVPRTYNYQNCVWQIADIKQKVENGKWTTEVTADCRPLSYINNAL